jgi:hypothetical protein
MTIIKFKNMDASQFVLLLLSLSIADRYITENKEGTLKLKAILGSLSVNNRGLLVVTIQAEYEIISYILEFSHTRASPNLSR